MTFNYIRNQIEKYPKKELLNYSFNHLNNNSKTFSYFILFTLIKWTLLYGEKKYPLKYLTQKSFSKIYNDILNFNEEHITDFMNNGKIDEAFLILYNQQFYLQKQVYKEIFAIQLKMLSSIKGRYDLEKSFSQKTGLTISDFLYILQIFWIYSKFSYSNNKNFRFNGYFDENFLSIIYKIFNKDKVNKFLNLLTVNEKNAEEYILKFKHQLRNNDLQKMEMTFFTMYPFFDWNGQIKLIHESVFKHSINYFIYDYLKVNDENFTTELGSRFEKYISITLDEININYKDEKQIKKFLPPHSHLTDFWLTDFNIYIECKAIEMQAFPSVVPNKNNIYNSLKKTLFKAYYEQIVSVSKILNPNEESWGVILTYKEFYWSQFSKLNKFIDDEYTDIDCKHIPAENVFIIDIYTWNKLIQILKSNKEISILDIFRSVKKKNSDPLTSKLLFNMHLEEDYKQIEKNINLKFLEDELEALKIRKEYK